MVVGDNLICLKEVIEIVENWSDILIFIGGFGLIEDDIIK